MLKLFSKLTCILVSAVVHCPSAETERMLHLPQLYRTVYDKPFVLPDRLAREVSSLPKGELDQKKLSHEVSYCALMIV